MVMARISTAEELESVAAASHGNAQRSHWPLRVHGDDVDVVVSEESQRFHDVVVVAPEMVQAAVVKRSRRCSSTLLSCLEAIATNAAAAPFPGRALAECTEQHNTGEVETTYSSYTDSFVCSPPLSAHLMLSSARGRVPPRGFRSPPISALGGLRPPLKRPSSSTPATAKRRRRCMY